MSATADEARNVQEAAECLFDQAAVDEAVQGMAMRLNSMLDGDETVALCVMTGAVVLAGRLLPLIDAPVLLDYVHATRYRERTTGGEIDWINRHRTPLAGRTVLIIDDILDEGYTLEAIARYCAGEKAARVITTVLVEKQHDRGCGFSADIVGLTVPDRYVFGCGMDYMGWLRNAPGIYAVAEARE